MSKKKLSKLLALYLPYVVIGLVATNLGEAWRLAVGCGQGTGRQNRIADGYAPGCIFKSAAQPAPI